MDSLHKNEASLDRDLHNGNTIHAAITLQNELRSNPAEALALIKSELCRATYADDKNHVSVSANGDVIISDKNNDHGVYAGTLSKEMKDQALHMNEPGWVEPAPPPPPIPVRHDCPPKHVPSAAPAPDGQNYEYQQPRHPGFHIPFPIDIGAQDGTLHVGLNVLGLADGGIMLGARNGAYVGSDVAQSRVSAGVDLNENHIGPSADWTVLNGQLTEGRAGVGLTPTRNGVDIGGGVDANALGRTVGTGAHGGAELGRHVGPHANGYAFAGPARVAADGYANLSDRGLRAAAHGDVGIQPVAGVHAGAKVGLGTRNEAHADAGANVGDNGASLGAGIYPQFHPDIYARGYSGASSAGLGVNPARAWARNQAQPQGDIEMGGLY